MSGSVEDVNDGNFKTSVLDAKELVMVDFCAVWSDICRSMEGIIKQIATDYKGKAQVAKLDIDENPQTPPEYGITAIPTFKIFKDGKVLGTRVGPSTYKHLSSLIDEHL